MNLILASQSPRRRELLGMLGVSFTIHAADVDETMDPALPPEQAVAAVSRRKADAVARLYPPDHLILAADTVVVAPDGQILGKPRDEADAARMLRLLSGQEHQVITAMTLRQGDREICRPVTTAVRFRPLTEGEIAAYIRTGESMDKAGAYAIQGMGSLLIEAIHGDYYTVMGLPLCALGQSLREFGVELLRDPAAPEAPGGV